MYFPNFYPPTSSISTNVHIVGCLNPIYRYSNHMKIKRDAATITCLVTRSKIRINNHISAIQINNQNQNRDDR